MTTPVEMHETKRQTLATVVVIHTVEGVVNGCIVYPDTKQGNVEAEKSFKSFVVHNCGSQSDEEIEICLENGYCEYGNHYVFITHS